MEIHRKSYPTSFLAMGQCRKSYLIGTNLKFISPRKKGRPLLNKPLQSKHPLLGNEPTPTAISRSTIDLSNYPCTQNLDICADSDVPLLDIHKVALIKVTHRLLLCPVVCSTERYKPARSDPCWVRATNCI
ncbi:hypothetical protein J6590_024266 [Homalodisca vitripennis]|nr:hypothetical protein J6590_024266 [Homalodisca vitripennis]